MTDQEQFKLAASLKSSCDDSGKEQNLQDSARDLQLLGKAHCYKSPDKFSLLQSAGLFNAAIVRNPSNANAATRLLSDLCSYVLELADASNKKADLIEKSKLLKRTVKELRSDVEKKLKNVRKIPKTSKKSVLMHQETKKIFQMQNIQHYITNSYKGIMRSLSEYCENVLGVSPCKFVIIGMGSLARSEITPYSDFEHVIVLEDTNCDEDTLEYFRWFSVIFHLVILNLGETIIPSLYIPNLNDPDSDLGDWFYDSVTPRGISFDGMMPHACKFPLGRQPTKQKPWSTELIKPVNEMLEYLLSQEDLKNGYHLSDILTQICFVYGDETLYEQFNDGVLEHKRKQPQDEINVLVTKQVQEDLDNFSSRLSLSSLHSKDSLNIKKVFYRSTTIFIAALAKFYKLSVPSCMEIIETLSYKSFISDYTKHKLKFAVAVACEVRLKWYMKMKSQCDVVQHQAKDGQQMPEFIKMFGKSTIINYFQIAYCLQCELMNKLNYRFKSHIYLHPELINIAICCGFKFDKKLNSIFKQTDFFDLPTSEILTFDNSLQLLEMETNPSTKTFLKPNLLQQTRSRQNYLERNKKSLNNIAEYLYKMGCIDEAAEFIRRALKIHEQVSSSAKDRNFARMLYLMGSCLMHQSKPKEAMTYYDESYATLCRSSSNPDYDADVANAARCCGMCLKQLDFKSWRLTLDQYMCHAIAIYSNLYSHEHIRTSSLPIALITDIGDSYFIIEDYKSASFYYNQAISSITSNSNGEIYNNKLAKLHEQRGLCLAYLLKFKESLEDLSQSFDIHEKLSIDKKELIKTSHKVANLLLTTYDNEITKQTSEVPNGSLSQISLALTEKLKSFASKKTLDTCFAKPFVYFGMITLLYRGVDWGSGVKNLKKKLFTCEDLF